nr:MAG TPA: hypothetical protein [Caudoviricetes sp.]
MITLLSMKAFGILKKSSARFVEMSLAQCLPIFCLLPLLLNPKGKLLYSTQKYR